MTLTPETIDAFREHEADCPDDSIHELLNDDNFRLVTRLYVTFMQDQLDGIVKMLIDGFTPDPRYMLDVAAFSCRAYQALIDAYEVVRASQEHDASQSFNGFSDLLRRAMEDGGGEG